MDHAQVWAPADDIAAGRADYATMVGPAILDYYEEYFGVKYPLPKMDLMLEPHKGGAMEVHTSFYNLIFPRTGHSFYLMAELCLLTMTARMTTSGLVAAHFPSSPGSRC